MQFRFIWSPEGRPLITIRAKSRADAVVEFKKKYPSQARYMGEVYVEEVQAETKKEGS